MCLLLRAEGKKTFSCIFIFRPINQEDFERMGFFVDPKINITGATTSGSLLANPALVGLDECARLAGKSMRHFIQSDLQLLLSVGAREVFDSEAHREGPLEPFATEQLTAATTCAHRESLHWLGDRLDVYFRFNMPVVRGLRLHPSSSHSLSDIISIALEYITDEKFFDLKRAAKILACNYKSREGCS
ncbi:hypothetical protein Efla_002927 [Eimeria flavescens]